MAKKLLEKTCLQCGATYKTTGPNSRFCSSACTVAYLELKEEEKCSSKVCPVCGKQFKGKNTATLYCSQECARKACCEREKLRRKENPQCGWGLETDPWQTGQLPRSVTENALPSPLP